MPMQVPSLFNTDTLLVINDSLLGSIQKPSFNEAKHQFTESSYLIANKLNDWVNLLISMLPNALLSVLLLIAFYLLAKYTGTYLSKLLNRISNNQVVNELVAGFSSIIVFTIGLSIALNVMNWDRMVVSLLAGVGLIGLAIGFAFQDIIINFISGIIIAFKRPYNVGDLIESNKFFGIVKKTNFRATILEDTEGKWIIIPNRQIIENAIINYSYTGRRRIDLSVGVAYTENLDEVKRHTLNVIKGLNIVDKNHPIDVFFSEFDNSSINLTIRFWIKFGKSQAHYLQAKSDAIIAIHQTYQQQNINIPYPITTVHLSKNPQ